MVVSIFNVTANVCTFADTSGVTELSGPFVMSQYGSLTLQYVSDRWVERARSLPTNLLISNKAPTIASGFGSSPSVTASNGANVFDVNVGTGGAATTGTMTMPAAATGWACMVNDITTNAKTTFQSGGSTTSVVVTATAAWSASDHLRFVCLAY